MLKTRLIPTLLLKDGRMVKGKNFRDFRDTGHPVKTAQVYNDQYVDELLFLDIGAARTGNRTAFEIIEKVSEEVFMPFTIGGGIRKLDDVEAALNSGADKVAITTAALENPNFVTQAANKYGSQCIVVGIDVTQVNGKYRVATHSGTELTEQDPFTFALEMEAAGAGELLVHRIDFDGMMCGYDIMLIRTITEAVNIPVIALGGAGKLDDFASALEHGKASAVSASSIFHFTDQSPIKVRNYLKNNGFNVRI